MTQIEKSPTSIWKAPDIVMDTVKDLISKYHPHLALIEDEIAVVFNEKASKAGDSVIAGKTAKASKLFGVLGDVDWKFIITIGENVWQDLTNPQKLALLDHHLCSCKAREKKDGGISYFLQPADVSFFKEEVERHGFWRMGGTEKVREDVIQEMFGKDNENE